jgi:hypothetical protein
MAATQTRVVAAVVFVVAISACAAGKKKQSDPIMPDVTARGRALYEYDQAAWHATDAVQAMHPRPQSVGRYIARKSDAAWTVMFGHLNEQRDEFLIAYEASQGATPQDFTVKPYEPPQVDKGFYLGAAKAIDTTLRDFRGEKRPYNVAILTAPSNQFYVYVVPAQTTEGVYPLGGDARYLITADGGTIVEKRQLHKTIIENRGELPAGATTKATFHTHILSEVPEDTDVFFVLARKPPMSEFIGTRNKKLYEIGPDGTIREGKL